MSNEVSVQKHFIIAPETTIEKCNKILESLGYITLSSDHTDNRQAPRKYFPLWRLAPSSSYHSVLNFNLGVTDADQLQYWSDCFRISAACLGSEVQPEASWFKGNTLESLRERAFIQGEQPIRAIDSPSARNLAEKFCYGALKKMEPFFRQQLSNKIEEPSSSKSSVDIFNSDSQTPSSSDNVTENSLRLSEQLRLRSKKLKATTTVVRTGGCVDGKVPENPPISGDVAHTADTEFTELWELYAKLYQNGVVSKIVAPKFGINESVVPNVGDTLIIVPALHSSLWSRWVLKDGYNPNFHWAPVVLVTDQGYVCLENFAVPNPLEINNKWEFRYYLFKDGGYHSKLTEQGGYGNIALTLLVRMT